MIATFRLTPLLMWIGCVHALCQSCECIHSSGHYNPITYVAGAITTPFECIHSSGHYIRVPKLRILRAPPLQPLRPPALLVELNCKSAFGTAPSPPLNPEGRRTVEAASVRPGNASEPSESKLALEDKRRSCVRPASQSPAPSSISPATHPLKMAKPPPPTGWAKITGRFFGLK